jgi:hypothetical protein
MRAVTRHVVAVNADRRVSRVRADTRIPGHAVLVISTHAHSLMARAAAAIRGQ